MTIVPYCLRLEGTDKSQQLTANIQLLGRWSRRLIKKAEQKPAVPIVFINGQLKNLRLFQVSDLY